MAEDAAPQATRLADYAPPDFLVDTVDLTFKLDDTDTLVKSRLAVRRNPAGKPRAPLDWTASCCACNAWCSTAPNSAPTATHSPSTR